MYFSELSGNQLRVSVDLRQTFEAYREARRNAARYAGGLAWKKVGGHDYLIKIINRRGGTKSLGPRSPDTEALYAEFVAGKTRAKEREANLAQSVQEFAGMAKGVFLNRVPLIVTAALRKLDDYGLLGKNLIVIGTNAMYGYESVAGVQFDAGLMATTDVDLLWDARAALKLALLDDAVAEAGVLAILQKVDRSFEPVRKGDFRAVNKAGFYVDLLKQAPNPPWKAGEPERIAPADLKPSWLPNMKWLLASEKFQSVVVGQDGLPAPMICPDPRAFAVYKQWLSEQPDREPGKMKRDQQQAAATIALVREKFSHLALDENAERMFPASVRKLSRGSEFGL
ncbi:MAG: nucleotidyltransferase domain-containing protein [Betaproteobacteria bacterium]|nr:nucleotidyltransferase domain-containing protein [Betaproteobacteria bacterium]MCL2887191.1 nucleotidyltransferase domain-containing protein [Betaproteobacteria bacterium]